MSTTTTTTTTTTATGISRFNTGAPAARSRSTGSASAESIVRAAPLAAWASGAASRGRDVAVDGDPCAAAVLLQRGRDRCRRVPLTTCVAALGAKNGAMVGLVD